MRHAVLLLAALVSGCATAETSPQGELNPTASTNEPRREGTIENIDVEALEAAEADGSLAVLVDVRTPEEFAEGHVPFAVNIPIHELAPRTGELEAYRGQKVHLICRSGGRSLKAANMLSAAGWDTVNVEGGTLAWTAAGKAVE